MGMDCPHCGTRQAVVGTITTEPGKGARKASDVIAFRLACGHTVGGEMYNEFQNQVQELKRVYAEKIRTLEAECNGKAAAIWKTMTETPAVV